jgi:hypothetical protein
MQLNNLPGVASMEEKRKPRRRTKWLVVGLILLVIYPLSMGPALALYGRVLPIHIHKRVFAVVYFPIIWLNHHGPEPV